MPELNGFTTNRKKKSSEDDELDRSLEGMEINDNQFDKSELGSALFGTNSYSPSH